MIHTFDGNLDSPRRLQELATVFDMTGLAFEIVRGTLQSNQAGLSLRATSVPPSASVALVGAIDDVRLDPEDLLRRLALALEADGIRFTLRLLDADGVARVTYESDR